MHTFWILFYIINVQSFIFLFLWNFSLSDKPVPGMLSCPICLHVSWGGRSFLKHMLALITPMQVLWFFFFLFFTFCPFKGDIFMLHPGHSTSVLCVTHKPSLL